MESPFGSIRSNPGCWQTGNSQQHTQQQQQQQMQRAQAPSTRAGQVSDHAHPAGMQPSKEAVSAVAAAASAAAAAAAAAVIAASGHDIQAQLRASPPAGFPFFGLPSSVFSQPAWQPDQVLHTERKRLISVVYSHPIRYIPVCGGWGGGGGGGGGCMLHTLSIPSSACPAINRSQHTFMLIADVQHRCDQLASDPQNVTKAWETSTRMLEHSFCVLHIQGGAMQLLHCRVPHSTATFCGCEALAANLHPFKAGMPAEQWRSGDCRNDMMCSQKGGAIQSGRGRATGPLIAIPGFSAMHYLAATM